MARTGRPRGSITKNVPKRFHLTPLYPDSTLGSNVVRISIKADKSTRETLDIMAAYLTIREVEPVLLDANLYAIHTDESEQVIWARIKDEPSAIKKVRNQSARLGLHFECVGRGVEIPLAKKTQVKGAQKIA